MKLLSIAIILLISFNLQAKDPEKKSENKSVSLSGQVIDIETGEALVGVALTIGNETAYTDFEGNYEFTELKSGTYTIETTYIAYNQKTETIKLKENKKLDISLTVK
jgi:uncharacterized membrane protein